MFILLLALSFVAAEKKDVWVEKDVDMWEDRTAGDVERFTVTTYGKLEEVDVSITDDYSNRDSSVTRLLRTVRAWFQVEIELDTLLVDGDYMEFYCISTSNEDDMCEGETGMGAGLKQGAANQPTVTFVKTLEVT